MSEATMNQQPSQAETIVTVSDAAAKQFSQLLQGSDEFNGIRVGVVGGGCAGLQYKMDPVAEPAPEDIVQEINGIPFYIHPMAVPYLKGVHIDFSTALIDGGFKFQNPNASSSCGCGTSFGI
jgi:iron-sulfur cluster assembly accessory protein